MRPTIRTLIPLSLTMSALDSAAPLPRRNKPGKLTLIALQEEHFISHCRFLVQAYSGIHAGDGAVGAAGDHVFALLAASVCHVVFFVAETGALVVLVHVGGAGAAFADSVFDGEETRGAGDAEIGVSAF